MQGQYYKKTQIFCKSMIFKRFATSFSKSLCLKIWCIFYLLVILMLLMPAQLWATYEEITIIRCYSLLYSYLSHGRITKTNDDIFSYLYLYSISLLYLLSCLIISQWENLMRLKDFI